jgi:hypothetical protein
MEHMIVENFRYMFHNQIEAANDSDSDPLSVRSAAAEVNTSHDLCSDSYSLLSTRLSRVRHDYIDFQFFYGQLFRNTYEEALDVVKLSKAIANYSRIASILKNLRLH